MTGSTAFAPLSPGFSRGSEDGSRALRPALLPKLKKNLTRSAGQESPCSVPPQHHNHRSGTNPRPLRARALDSEAAGESATPPTMEPKEEYSHEHTDQCAPTVMTTTTERSPTGVVSTDTGDGTAPGTRTESKTTVPQAAEHTNQGSLL